ncbi:hypothetical protein SRHO_G00224170 [Serrasalmus rhombeus]
MERCGRITDDRRLDTDVDQWNLWGRHLNSEQLVAPSNRVFVLPLTDEGRLTLPLPSALDHWPTLSGFQMAA